MNTSALEFMTKDRLCKYAKRKGVEVTKKTKLTKAEIIDELVTRSESNNATQQSNKDETITLATSSTPIVNEEARQETPTLSNFDTSAKKERENKLRLLTQKAADLTINLGRSDKNSLFRATPKSAKPSTPFRILQNKGDGLFHFRKEPLTPTMSAYEKRKAFNLTESLTKPLPYKQYTGKLKRITSRYHKDRSEKLRKENEESTQLAKKLLNEKVKLKRQEQTDRNRNIEAEIDQINKNELNF